MGKPGPVQARLELEPEGGTALTLAAVGSGALAHASSAAASRLRGGGEYLVWHLSLYFFLFS